MYSVAEICYNGVKEKFFIYFISKYKYMNKIIQLQKFVLMELNKS